MRSWTVPPWVGRDAVRVIRIISEFTSEADSEKSISSYFTPMQDGVELALGVPNEKVETDITLSTKIQPGETVTVSSSYVLYNTDPVFDLLLERGTVYGAFFPVE